MKKYQAPKIEVTVFEVEDVVTTNWFSSVNLGEWDYLDKATNPTKDAEYFPLHPPGFGLGHEPDSLRTCAPGRNIQMRGNT